MGRSATARWWGVAVTMSGLVGRTVAATRAAEADDDFVRMLERAGACPLVWPTIDFEPTSTPDAFKKTVDALADFDWIVFTSPRAARAVTSRLDGCPRGLRVGSVGPSTDAALRRAGWSSDVIGRGGASALIEEITSLHILEGARVLFPASSLASDTVEREVQKRGGRVERVEAYRTVSLRPDKERLLADLRHGVDVVTFASPSGVRSLAVALEVDWPQALQPCGIAAIGSSTAAALMAQGVGARRIQVADPANLNGLLDATIRALPEPGSAGSSLSRQPLQAATLKDDAS